MIHTKHEILDALNGNTQNFMDEILKMNKADFENAAKGKWSPGQHLVHLIKSIKPINFALSLPPFVPYLLFGKAKNVHRTFEEIKQFYQAKLADGAKATGAYIPSEVFFADKEKLGNTFRDETKKMAKKLTAKKEEEIDTMLLPHPILGKLTLREMLFFTVYHVEHHTKSVRSSK